MDVSYDSDVIKKKIPVKESVLLLCRTISKPSTFICNENIDGCELGWMGNAQNNCTQTF